MSSSYAPTGRAEAVDGGYRLSGRWSFSSGCDHASWVLLGGIVADARASPVDFRTFLLPPATTRSRTCGTPSGCAAPAATTSSSRTRSCPSTGR